MFLAVRMGACSLSLSSPYWREFSRIAGDGEGEHCNGIALSSGHSQILSRSRGHVTYKPNPPFLGCNVVLIPGLLPIFLHGCEIKSGCGLGTRLAMVVCMWTTSAALSLLTERLELGVNTVHLSKIR